MKVSAEVACPISVIENRQAATEVLHKTWLKIEEFEKEYFKTGRVDLQVQIEHMKKQCMEIMENVRLAEGRDNSSDIQLDK